MKNLSAAFLVLAAIYCNAQNTFTTINGIFQSKCASCHSGSSPSGGLNLSGSEATVYNAIVEVAPTNAAANALGDKLIDKGYPERSFLLRKVAYGLSDDLQLHSGEGLNEPNGQPKLADHEIELIRQWIIQGAPQSGNVVDYQRLTDYYTTGGRPKITRPTPPPSGQGFQIHFGPVFWGSAEESEYFKKYDPRISQNLDVYRFEILMNSESHHFILRKYQPGQANSISDGLQPFTTQAFSNGKDFINAWQTSTDLELPMGTGFFWDQSTVLDLNYHMLNSHSEILPGEVYINVYTRPHASITVEMKAELIPYFYIFIPNNSQPVSFTDNVQRSGQTWNIWMLSTHTHKYGTDYDIFLRNSNGSQGQQLYEGYYNFNYTFNQNYYEWSHPPVRRFSPMMTVNMSNGLIHKAVYKNNGPQSVTWGFTTSDEMMLIYVQYTTQAVNYTPPVNIGGNNPGCNSVTLSTDGGLASYNWSNGATTQSINVTSSGNYSVTVSDGSGSTYTSTPVSVTVNHPAVSINNGNDPSICSGQSATLNAGSAAAYQWSTGATTASISINNPGDYYVTITDGSGCTASDVATVSTAPGPNVSINDAQFCAGENAILNAGNAGASFNWSTGATTQTITVSAAGNYTVTVTDGNGCSNSDAAMITVYPLPALNLLDITICQGSNATFDAGNPGSNYIWSTGATSQTITVAQDDAYSVTVTNANGCVNSDQASVSYGANLSVNIADESICDGSSVVLDAGFPGSNYAWSNGATTQTISVNAAGTFSVTVDDPAGCDGSDDATVALLANPTADAGEDKIICKDESVDLTATGGSFYEWSTGATGSTVNVNQPGSYNVTVTAANGCTASDKVDVALSLVNTGNINGEADVDEHSNSAYYIPLTSGSNYTWTVSNGTIVSGQGSESVEVNWGAAGTGTVSVIETNADGCAGEPVSLEVTIGAVGVSSLAQSASLLIYPNPFTSSFNISFPYELHHYALYIHDLTGKVLYHLSEVNGTQLTITPDNLAEGVYFLQLKGEKEFRAKVVLAN